MSDFNEVQPDVIIAANDSAIDWLKKHVHKDEIVATIQDAISMTCEEIEVNNYRIGITHGQRYLIPEDQMIDCYQIDILATDAEPDVEVDFNVATHFKLHHNRMFLRFDEDEGDGDAEATLIPAAFIQDSKVA